MPTSKPRLIAIDPGDRHIGVALYVGDECKDARTFTDEHSLFYGNLVHWLSTRDISEIVVEEFVLYPWVLQQQGFSKMETARCIGVIEYLCGLAGVPLVMQGADVKKPAFSIMKARGVHLLGDTQHAKDAVAHGYYRRHAPPPVKPKAEE